MNATQRRGWLIVAVIFLTIFLGSAGYFTQSLFFNPILKTFGWSRAQISTLPSMINIAIAFGVLLVGWLLDRIAARLIIASGLMLIVVSFVLSAHAHFYSTLLVADLIMGLGIAASSMVPGAFLVANWFDANRAVAMAVIANGAALGGMTSNLIVNLLIAAFGWRSAYLLLTLPLLFVMIPLGLLVLRNPPRPKLDAAAPALPGYELREAFGTTSFWMLVLCPALHGLAANGLLLHLVPNMISLGYARGRAALAVAMLLGCAGVTKIVLGLVADRSSGRRVLMFDLLVFGAGITCFGFARYPLLAVLGVVIGGSASGAPTPLFHFVIAEAMGLKRYGTIAGLANWATYMGGICGMIGGGWIFDHTGSYQIAFLLFGVAGVVSGLGVLGVHPYRDPAQSAATEVQLASVS